MSAGYGKDSMVKVGGYDGSAWTSAGLLAITLAGLIILYVMRGNTAQSTISIMFLVGAAVGILALLAILVSDRRKYRQHASTPETAVRPRSNGTLLATPLGGVGLILGIALHGCPEHCFPASARACSSAHL